MRSEGQAFCTHIPLVRQGASLPPSSLGQEEAAGATSGRERMRIPDVSVCMLLCPHLHSSGYTLPAVILNSVSQHHLP